MRFGYNLVAQNYWDWERFRSADPSRPLDYPDHKVVAEALDLAVLAEELGFDTIWSTEHHFTPYLMTPSLTQLLSYIAGRTRRADVGSDVIVLPWHDPVRVAEELAVLDIMLGDRKMYLGFGRGAGADEFEGMRVPMSESRGRFAEALEIVRRGLSGERFAFQGQYFTLPEIEIRPRPRRDLASQMYCAWMSPETLEIAAKQELGAMFAVTRALEDYPGETAAFNSVRNEIGLDPVNPIVINFVYVAETEAEAMEGAIQYAEEYWESTVYHYKWVDTERYNKIGGYDFYTALGEKLATQDADEGRKQIIANNLWGTPAQVIEKIEALHQASTASEIGASFRYGSMPFDIAQRNVRLFGEKVLPTVHQFADLAPRVSALT
jgi:alkanesulfonate monooxygenase SsuD/methylene tetrahydromethanopterin reductase-like flavin-dependent oxidoreductase (luciferase family)